MESIPNGPLDDIKKMGEILMKRTSEKEFYRFLHIQEQCRLKWQTTLDEITQLAKNLEKSLKEKDVLAANLQHVSQLWEMEKEFRRSAEYERNFFKMKLNQTYELLRYDRGMEQAKCENNQNNENAKNNDEITSTGSFLSDLSGISRTEDDYVENTEAFTSRQLAVEFDGIFDDVHEENLENIAKSMTSLNSNLFEKTFRIKPTKKRHQQSNKIDKKHGHDAKDNNRAQLVDPDATLKPISLDKIEPDPIYERVDDVDSLFGINSKGNERKLKNEVAKASNDLLYATVVKSEAKSVAKSEAKSVAKSEAKAEEVVVNINCQHSFSHRTASRSDVCFHCSKKFKFGILAYKCTSCGVFAHHKCKNRFKAKSKPQRFKNNAKKYYISDYTPNYGPYVPALIIHCVNEVETRGLSERGIYRVSGSEREVKALLDRFLYIENIPDLSNTDMHVVCGCIKNFLRSLREPLIPMHLWHVFSNAVNGFDGDSIDGNIQSYLQFEISRLPKANRDTLAFLILHLQRVATCAEIQMPISNLAKVFGPTVVGYSKQEPDNMAILGETYVQQNVMEMFLNIPTDFWISFICEDIEMYEIENETQK